MFQKTFRQLANVQSKRKFMWITIFHTLAFVCSALDTALCIALWSLTWSVLMGYNDSSLSKSSTFSQKQVLLQHAQRREWWWDGRYFYHCPYKRSKGGVFHQQSSWKPDAVSSAGLTQAVADSSTSSAQSQQKGGENREETRIRLKRFLRENLIMSAVWGDPVYPYLGGVKKKFAAAVRLDSQSNFLNNYFS